MNKNAIDKRIYKNGKKLKEICNKQEEICNKLKQLLSLKLQQLWLLKLHKLHHSKFHQFPLLLLVVLRATIRKLIGSGTSEVPMEEID